MLEEKVNPLLNALSRAEEYARLCQTLREGGGPAGVLGLSEGGRAHAIAALGKDCKRNMLVITPGESQAGRLTEELSAYMDGVISLPARDMPLSGKAYSASNAAASRRIDALLGILSGKYFVLVLSAEAFLQRLAPPESLTRACMRVAVGETRDPLELVRALILSGYERVDQCESPGQLCLRGGRLDVFPPGAEQPCRIEFFGDEIDTMREYDPVSQRASCNVESVLLPPATETPLDEASIDRAKRALSRAGGFDAEVEDLSSGAVPKGSEALLPFFYEKLSSALDYAGEGALIFLDEPSRVRESAEAACACFLELASDTLQAKRIHKAQAELMMPPEEAFALLDTPRTALLFAIARTFQAIKSRMIFNLASRPIPSYTAGGDEALRDDLVSWKRGGYTVLLFAGAHGQRLSDRLGDMGLEAALANKLEREIVPGEMLIVCETLLRGFEYPELKLAVVSESELYGSVSRRGQAKKRRRPQLLYEELEVGDLVVHETYGIGRFTGMESLTVDEKTRDYLTIVYAGGDKLFLPTDQLDMVQKYIGGEDAAPKLSKLGGVEWLRAVNKARESVKKLAFDLVKLYGSRRHSRGFRFSPDTPWQRQMEDSFPYEETPDQILAIDEVKADMESERVMDRLICGDVGYGKTEVALRAAFKAVMDGKQVALLVPTTILAEQHYNTFTSRFSGFPITVEMLSRFKTDKEQADTIARMASGEADVVIGTHRLLSKNIRFKDLGLLIVDEEQRFGVGHKEQIKNMKRDVDVITLTATPIPRTLHMSMTGIRDMSVIETPPDQRYPVQTYVIEYSDAMAREAILKELGRGGQVYFLYNNVRGMERFADKLRSIVPEARIACANGQMSERSLESAMLSFLDGQYDVLLCSTIIENGLDISNVNTIIVYDADKLGLAQLYQLRGRVGRGARLGYAYLTFLRGKVITEVAEKRLSAIREFTQFGAGFRLALRDLEIRGAGNLLGPEQHGHMAEIGYDLYCKLMDEAVREARGEAAESNRIETSLEIPVDAHIPKAYIAKESSRMSMYKRIASIETEEEMRDVQDELLDRYGDIPAPVQRLLDGALLKAAARRAYLTRIQAKPGELRLSFHPLAPVSPEKLIAFTAKTPGAKLLGGESPTVLIRQKDADVDTLYRELPQFVYMLGDCIDLENKL